MMMKHTSPGLRCCCAAILLLSLAVAPAAAAVQWDGVAITTGDYEGLLAIKQALLDPSGYLGGWNDSGLNACSGAWEGIKCARGQVIAIQLPWHGLGGTISEKLGQLTALRKLNLHDNAIQGQVPAAIGLLRNLRGVYLFNNHFSGSVPSSIGDCLLLQTLDLSNNVITGSIPASVSNLTGLYRFNLSHNKLVGSIPTGLARLPSLSFLSLEHNNLSGAIPDAWGGAGVTHRLKILSLDGNSLSGPIPASLSSLPMLQELNLGWNLINGSIPEELGKLPMLQRMDLSSNSIGGVLPESLCNMSSLVHLDLEGNQLEGEIPNSVDGLKSLGFLSLRRNRLRGPLPWRLGYVANLSELDLSENNFGGEIPASYARLVHLGSFNVSSNNLSGAVPLLLAERFDSSAFSGNVQLCGYSAAVPCHASSPPPSSSSAAPAGLGNGGASGSGRTRKLTVGNVVILIVVACAALLVVLCCVLLVYWFIRKRAAALSGRSGGAAAGVKQGEGGGGEPESGGDAGGKLVHFDGPILFTADDLLCATAEIMGKTTYGTVYKATLEDGSQVAVKRLREKITKGQKEFEAEAAVLGRIRHSNLLPLRAYYLGPKGEKLLVFDYMPNGSLAAFLHARGPETTIDWPRRARIAAGIARGLLHLHTHESIVHGGLTSANIFLDDGYAPRISEYGLSRLTTASAAATPGALATAGSLGYRAPELAAKQKKASAKTDVYSLGVLLLELLTGKSPGEPVNGLELPQWVVSVVEEDWPSEVFDLELTREGAAGEEELVAALKLALHCVDPAPASRPEVEQVLRQLEEMRPELREGGEDGGRPDAGGSAAA